VDLSTIRPYGSGIEWGAAADGWYAISGAGKIAAALGVRHRRVFLYRPGSVLVVVDEVDSEDERSYRRLFHLGPQLEVSGEAGRLQLRGASFRGYLVESSQDSVSGRLVRGQREPSLQGWLFPEYRRWQENWTVEYECRRASARLVTTLSLRDEPVQARVTEGAPGSLEIGLEADGLRVCVVVGPAQLDVR